jgi:ferredoxin
LHDRPQNPEPDIGQPFDLLHVPVAGRILRWRHARTILQIPLLLIAIAMVLHGLFGPTISPKNLATTLGWVHFRGALVLVILLAGNFFCLACPMMAVRNFGRLFFQPVLNWPRRLRNKWLSISLFVAVLFSYELFSLWSSPWWTAWLIVAYFAGALVVDMLFKHASFCKFVCPIGQFNFIASTISPLEVRVREAAVCTSCKTKDCIRGSRPEPSSPIVIQRGCELALFQPHKYGNLDCTFCLDCIQACPFDNVGIISRQPAAELAVDKRRSGVGLLSRRPDLAALSILFTFGALLNAFGMVSPVYVVESWLARLFHVSGQAPVLGLLFVLALIVEPAILLSATAWFSRASTMRSGSILQTMVQYSYGLVPLGFGVWLAHYGFHFLTGLFTFIPVTQNAFVSLGLPILGEPRWMLVGLPQNVVSIIGYGFLGLGLLGSLLVNYRIAEADYPRRPLWAFLPWAMLSAVLWASAMWLMSQPMQMRVTSLG